MYREEKLVWSDEFDVDGQPNPNKWTYNIGNEAMVGGIMNPNIIQKDQKMLPSIMGY